MAHMVAGPLMNICTELYIVFKGDEAYVQIESKYCKHFIHLCRMYILINWTSPFPILGLLGGLFHLYSNFKKTLP